MSTYDTDLDSINNICSLVKEIVELTENLDSDEIYKNLIKDKALTIKDKATRMEERLKTYKKGIEELGFKRIKRRSK